VISPARRISFDLLYKIDSGRVFSDNVLNSDIMYTVDVRDRHLITEIVYGTLRRKSLLDYILARASSKPWEDVETGTKVLLRMSLYQLWFMDRIPDHALVNDAVELSKVLLRGNIYRYLNGILRQLARTPPWKDESFLNETPKYIQVSLPKWLWNRWKQRYGEDTASEYAESLNNPPTHALRMDKVTDVSRFPFTVHPSDIVPGAFIGNKIKEEKYRNFYSNMSFQDEASQLIPHLFGDLRGGIVWDACAAPGGKTAVLCENMSGSGRVVASDISRKRMGRLRDMLDRSRSRAEILVADAKGPLPFRVGFDAVIADVPCSGLGTLRRNPEIKWRFRSSDLPRLQKNQLSIIESVSNNVRLGGRMIYSTCSTEPEENEAVVGAFLDMHHDFRIVRPSNPSGIDALLCKDCMVRTFPSTRRWDGLFAVLMMRYR